MAFAVSFAITALIMAALTASPTFDAQVRAQCDRGATFDMFTSDGKPDGRRTFYNCTVKE
jgi:hypothetical protein